MKRILAVCGFGILLTCCDRQDGGQSADKEPEADGSSPGRAERKPRQERPEASSDPVVSLREKLAIAETLASPAEREKAIAEVAWNAIELEGEIAHEAFAKLSSDNPEKIRLIQHYALRLAEQDPAEALAWAALFTDEREHSAAMAQIAVALAEKDPRRAADMLSESGIAGRELDVAVVQVIQRWAAGSPPDAGAWVTAFPPGKARTAGIGIVAERWLASDAKAAFAWLGGMQDTELRRETARAMEGFILQQPAGIREEWLQHADAGIRSELESQRAGALKDVGDNIPETQP